MGVTLRSGDLLDEDNQVFSLRLSNPSEGSGLQASADTADCTITDDDNPPTLDAVADVSVDEDAEDLVLTLTLSSPSKKIVTLVVDTEEVTADDASDYQPVTGHTVTFAPGSTNRTVTITVNADDTYEADETFDVVLSQASNVQLTNSRATVTVVNDDSYPSVRFAPATVSIDEDAGDLVLTVELSNPSDSPMGFAYNTQDGTTQAQDYTAVVGGTLSFAAGETSQTITVSIQDDAVSEPDETFSVVIVDNNDASNTATATVTLVNDDGVPAITIDSVTLPEGDAGTSSDAVFTVTLDRTASYPISVQYATADVTAVAGSDYVALPDTQLTFAAGETSKIITVTVTGDIVDEDNETFVVNLSGLIGDATLNVTQGTATVTNDDVPPSVSFENPTMTVEESSLTVEVTVTLSYGHEKTVTVDYNHATISASGMLE